VALTRIDPENKAQVVKGLEPLILAQKPETPQAAVDPAAKALAADAAGALIKIGTPAVVERLMKALEKDYTGADDLNTVARYQVYLILEQLKDVANFGENALRLGKFRDREKSLAQDPRYANPLHRETFEKAKAAFTAVYNAPRVKKD
jgi:hypothetical protein